MRLPFSLTRIASLTFLILVVTFFLACGSSWRAGGKVENFPVITSEAAPDVAFSHRSDIFLKFPLESR